MSGHSKWSTIKRKKGANDAARGKVFSRISKEIMIAVRDGGGDPSANTRLRTAIMRGHAENMPNANIERAIKKALGDNDGVSYEEISYEGYAQGGVAVLVHCLTDNKNRTGPEVRHLFGKYDGSLGEAGCVSYMFTRKGYIQISPEGVDEDELMEVALNAGAEDVVMGDDEIEIYMAPEQFPEVMSQVEEKSYKILQAEVSLFPDSYVSIDDKEIESATIELIEQMEDLDDVQSVSHNLEISVEDE